MKILSICLVVFGLSACGCGGGVSLAEIRSACFENGGWDEVSSDRTKVRCKDGTIKKIKNVSKVEAPTSN